MRPPGPVHLAPLVGSGTQSNPIFDLDTSGSLQPPLSTFESLNPKRSNAVLLDTGTPS